MAASTLVRVEVARTLNRLRIEGVYSDAQHAAGLMQFTEMAEGVEWILVSEAILALAAEPTAYHMKALDAVHIATARAVRSAGAMDLVFATHDRRLAAAASANGFEVAGV